MKIGIAPAVMELRDEQTLIKLSYNKYKIFHKYKFSKYQKGST